MGIFMGKYDGLYTYLDKSKSKNIKLTYNEIEKIIGCSLPVSAYRYRPWWGNTDKTHNQCK